MAMMASGYLDLKYDVNSAAKYLRVAIDSCKKGTYHAGEELRAMLAILKLTRHSKDEEIKAAMDIYFKRHLSLLEKYNGK